MAFLALKEVKREAEANGHTEIFSSLAECVFTELWWKWKYCQRPLEKQYYSFFSEALPSLIPGGSLVKVPLIKGHIPDFFVQIDGEIAPIEIKRGDISISAVKQLKRYMDTYKTRRGYVVGHKLNARLQKGMIFCEWKPQGK